MNIYILTSWFKALVFLLPLFWSGLVLTRRGLGIKRAEVVFPAAFILGITSYIFLLNAVSFIIRPSLSLAVSYVLLVFLALAVSLKVRAQKIDFPENTSHFFWFISLFFWAVFLFVFIGQMASFGGDTTLYYSIAKTFARGNFPIVSPWQPDLSVGYHYGASIFLGAFNWFTNLPFEFLHRLTAFFLLLSLSQLLIWLWRRHHNFFVFVLYQLLPIVFLITIGTFMLVRPVFPLDFPAIKGFNDFISWAINLPSVHISFETWGAAVNLGLTVYFLHQFSGLAMFGLGLILALYPPAKKRGFNLGLLLVILSSLALTNESIFLPTAFCLATAIFLREVFSGTLKKNFLLLTLIAFLTAATVVAQGGVISDVILRKDSHLEKSIYFFPQKEDIPGDFKAYHWRQQNFKLFPVKDEWKPLQYYHIGFKWLYLASALMLIGLFLKKDKSHSVLFAALLVAALVSSFAYNFIVPKFKVADGNRLMGLAYQFLGLAITFFFVWLVEGLWKEKKKASFIFALFLTAWIFSFSMLQPIAELGRTNSGINKLLPERRLVSPTIQWLKENVPYNARVLYLDVIAPFSPKSSEVMIDSGVFTPSFTPQYRAYTTGGGPEFLDLVYTLNPSGMNFFGTSYLVVDSEFYKNLAMERKKDLQNPNFFALVFETKNSGWERIYSVKEGYLKEGKELGGTFEELKEIIPVGSKFLIGEWKDVSPWNQLRKSVIFALKDKKPVFVWGPGVYLNVLTWIDWGPPGDDEVFDFYVLSEDTNPESVCDCKTHLVWKGINDNIKVWKVLR